MKLSNGEKLVVLAVLHIDRKSTSVSDLTKDENDLNDVLDVLAKCGYQVLPRGIVDALKKALGQLK